VGVCCRYTRAGRRQWVLRAWRLDMIAGMEPSGSGYGTKASTPTSRPNSIVRRIEQGCAGLVFVFGYNLHPYHTYQRTETHLITAIAHSGYGSVHAPDFVPSVGQPQRKISKHFTFVALNPVRVSGCMDRTIA